MALGTFKMIPFFGVWHVSRGYYDISCVGTDRSFTRKILESTIAQQCCNSAVFPALNRISVTVSGWGRERRREGQRRDRKRGGERERGAPKWVFHLYASGWLRGVLLKDKDWPLRPLKTNRGPGTACYNSSITAAPLCSTIHCNR